ncbi:asparagine synthase (glutamine-hydrolyzing) [bacterium]|nr:asparagine synthase (glutamine-hydrolyzing) [bacterium]MCI0605483.1 asparagine synthase (glutamine-hydrolyzing) [bacterium]
MCGIAGIFFFQPQVLPETPLRKMVAALSHRGPDHEGFYFGKQALLGYRRLSIIDLSAAASQPMCDESRRFAVIFNGEIYNFRELRKQLSPSTPFFSHSDTEVILRLFQQHQENTWPLLNGMFAIGVLDEQNQELFLARDHAGIKPLYYYQDHEKFLFASEPRALLASQLVSADIDQDALSLYLQLGYFPAPFTPYAKIRKLNAGSCIRVSSNGVEIHPYWKIPSEIHVPEHPEEDLEQLLLNSVEQQMISDVPVGAFLSGGIDSSLIVAFMSRIAGRRVQTFTAGFSGMGYYDERPDAEKIAKQFNTEHHDFVVSEPLVELVTGLASVFGEPFADSSAVPTSGLARLTSKHVKVALSGTGGDEIFGGYRKYMAAHWASAYTSLPGAVRQTIRKTVGLLPASRRSLWEERALLLQRFSDLSPQIPPNWQLNAVFSLDEIRKLSGKEPVPVETLFSSTNGTIVENMMRFDYDFYLPEDLLVKEDRCTMAFGLESRVPYLHRDLIEFMNRLPVKYKVSRTSTKRLFRKVAAKYLPSWVLSKPKHGFGSPASEWIRGELKQLAERAVLNSQFFPGSALLRQKWQEHQQGTYDHSKSLWAVLMLELWRLQIRS